MAMKSCGWVLVLACVILADGVAEERAPAGLTFKNKELEDRWNSWPEGIRKLFEKALGKARMVSLKGAPALSGSDRFGLPKNIMPEYTVEAENESNTRCKLEVHGEFMDENAGELEYIEFKTPRTELPKLVLDAAERMMPNAAWNALARIEGRTNNLVYLLSGKSNGKKVELRLNSRGEVPPVFLDFVPAENLPVKVREAALKQAPGMILKESVKWKSPDGGVYYAVNGSMKNEFMRVYVSEDGRILEDIKP
jgi:hypothetical protein